MSEKNEYQAFTRADLMKWVPDGERQAHAWNRLRRVCIELRVKIPTMKQVRGFDMDFAGDMYIGFRDRYNASDVHFDDEFTSVMICEDESGDGSVFVQFDAGYRME